MFRRLCIGFVFLSLLAGACGRPDGPVYGSALERLALDEAGYYVVFPRLEQVRDDFLTLVVNMEGMEGLLALIEGATRVDLADEDLLSQAGLDGDFRPLLLEQEGVPVVCLGMSSSSRFLSYIKGLAESSGLTWARIVTDGPDIYRLGSGLALSVHGNLALVAVGSGSDPTVALASILLTETPAQVPEFEEGLYHVSYAPGPGLSLEARASGWYGAVGPAAGVVRSLVRYFDACSSFSGSIAPGDRYLVSGRLSGCTVPFAPAGVLAPESRLPDDTILLVHSTFSGESLWDLLPGAIQLLVGWAWQDLPEKLPESLAGADNLLSRFVPEVAVAFLGLTLDASLDTFTSRKRGGDEPIFGAHLVLMLALKEGAGLDELFDEKVTTLLLPNFEGRGLGTGRISGTEFCRKKRKKKKKDEEEKRCFSVLRQQDRVFVVTGIGEGERLVRTLQGQRESLGGTLFARQEAGALTVTLKTKRLVRDLVSKGFPPYFLQVLASVLEIRLTAGTDGEDTKVELEMVMR
jgi:hypothetical protein